VTFLLLLVISYLVADRLPINLEPFPLSSMERAAFATRLPGSVRPELFDSIHCYIFCRLHWESYAYCSDGRRRARWLFWL